MENEQLNYLKELIKERITSVSGSRNYYRKGAFKYIIGTAFLAALNTVLLGLHFTNWENEIRITVLVMSAIITIVNTYNAIFNFKDLWIANNDALNGLYELRFNIEFYEKGIDPLDLAQVEKFRLSYQKIHDELNSNWHKIRGAGK